VRLPEQEILIQSVMETVVPKLVADDIPLLHSLLTDVFPGMQYAPAAMTALREEISKVCDEEHLVGHVSLFLNSTATGMLFVQSCLLSILL